MSDELVSLQTRFAEAEADLERLRALVVETANDLGDARHERDQLEILLSKVEADVAAYRLALEGTTHVMEQYYKPGARVYAWMRDIISANRSTLSSRPDPGASLLAYRQATAALRVAWERMTACYDEFGPLGALDACGELQEALDEAILAVFTVDTQP